MFPAPKASDQCSAEGILQLRMYFFVHCIFFAILIENLGFTKIWFLWKPQNDNMIFGKTPKWKYVFWETLKTPKIKIWFFGKTPKHQNENIILEKPQNSKIKI